jgi:hypothetical protein
VALWSLRRSSMRVSTSGTVCNISPFNTLFKSPHCGQLQGTILIQQRVHQNASISQLCCCQPIDLQIIEPQGKTYEVWGNFGERPTKFDLRSLGESSIFPPKIDGPSGSKWRVVTIIANADFCCVGNIHGQEPTLHQI